jgi:hypothetical protein
LQNPREPDEANEMHTDTVEKITAAIVGLLCLAAWLTAVLYFSFTMEF